MRSATWLTIMFIWAVFNRADGMFVSATRYLPAPRYDAATQILLELSPDPNPSILVDGRMWRWDGAAGIRAATVQEQAAWDAAHYNR